MLQVAGFLVAALLRLQIERDSGWWGVLQMGRKSASEAGGGSVCLHYY